MTRISIRTARAEDAGAVSRLNTQLGYELSEAEVAARLSRLLGRDDRRFFVADSESAVVGWLYAAVIDSFEAGPFVMIGGLVVDRAYRRQGIGRQLLQEAERWAGAQGCAFVRLWSSVARTAAHRFYEQAGYTNVKTQHAFVKALDASKRDRLASLVPSVRD